MGCSYHTGSCQLYGFFALQEISLVLFNESVVPYFSANTGLKLLKCNSLRPVYVLLLVYFPKLIGVYNFASTPTLCPILYLRVGFHQLTQLSSPHSPHKLHLCLVHCERHVILEPAIFWNNKNNKHLNAFTVSWLETMNSNIIQLSKNQPKLQIIS